MVANVFLALQPRYGPSTDMTEVLIPANPETVVVGRCWPSMKLLLDPCPRFLISAGGAFFRPAKAIYLSRILPFRIAGSLSKGP